MNRLWRFLRGYRILELMGASPDWALNVLTQHRIPFWNVRWTDRFTVRICVFPQDAQAVSRAAERAMCQVRDGEDRGLRERLGGILRRPALWAVLLLSVAVVMILPNFVLFYTVEGCETVTEEQILQALDSLGVGFGIYGPHIKPQWIEDHMLNLVEGLQWITVNQSGCKAKVQIRERIQTPVVQDRKGFANVIASRGGILLEQTVWTGQPLKQPGDVVTEGEMLVSGVVDLERTFLLTRAQAEIYAGTRREYEAVMPAEYTKKGEILGSKVSVWLEIGKRRIKIFGNSGISTACCDKMSSRKRLSLPGDHALPVSLFVERYICRSLQPGRMQADAAEKRLRDVTERTALEQMTAGLVLRRRETMTTEHGLHRFFTALDCREMIARTAEANWIEEDYNYD